MAAMSTDPRLKRYTTARLAGRHMTPAQTPPPPATYRRPMQHSKQPLIIASLWAPYLAESLAFPALRLAARQRRLSRLTGPVLASVGR